MVNRTWPSVLAPNFPVDRDPDLASDFYERLDAWIREFESNLDEDHDVGVRLVSFGQALFLHLADITWWNPALIRFDGPPTRGIRCSSSSMQARLACC